MTSAETFHLARVSSDDVHVVGLDQVVHHGAPPSRVFEVQAREAAPLREFVSALGSLPSNPGTIGVIRADSALPVRRSTLLPSGSSSRRRSSNVMTSSREIFIAYQSQDELRERVREGWNSALMVFNIFRGPLLKWKLQPSLIIRCRGNSRSSLAHLS